MRGGEYLNKHADGQSKHSKKITHLRRNRRSQLGPVGAGIAGNAACRGSFWADGLKPLPTPVGLGIGRSADAETRRVSNRCDTTTMHATSRLTIDPTFARRCPGCPGGVLPGPPWKWDTRTARIRASNLKTHGKDSEVSCLSWVIPKTIAYAGADAHMRPVNGYRNQAGQPGHPGGYRPILGVGSLRRAKKVSHFERSQAGHPRTAGTSIPSDRRCL